jgi:UV DNA damage endonuclease
VVENDESWPLVATLALAEPLGLPVAFDAFHHRLAPSFQGLSVRDVVLRAGETWHEPDGRQEIHFSTQDPRKRRGAHAETLDLVAFERFPDVVGDLPLDGVLEVKDKERSALQAMAALAARTAQARRHNRRTS